MPMPHAPLARTVASAAAALSLTLAGLVAASAETSTTTVDGRVLDVVVDTPDAPSYEHVLVSDAGEVTVIDAPDALAEAESGSEVTATVAGTASADGAEVLAATVVDEPAAAAAVSAHRAYVVAIDDPAVSGDVALGSATSVTRSAAAYWVREARGAISALDVAGTATLTLRGSCASSYETLWGRAAALFPAVDFAGAANHLIVYSPRSCAYPYTGIASVGRLSGGGYVQIVEPNLATVVHELGHNLGLGHADVLADHGDGSGFWWEYYGIFGPQAGTVGDYPPGVLDAGFRYLLDLPGFAGQTATIDTATDASTTLTLAPTGSSTGTTAAMIVDEERGEAYFVEYRHGADDDLATYYASAGLPRLDSGEGVIDYAPGVVVSVLDGDFLDFLATYDAIGGVWEASRLAGQTYIDPDSRFTVDVLSASGAAATISIATGAEVDPVRAESSTAVTVPTTYEGTAATATVTVSSATSATGTVDLLVDDMKVRTVTLSAGRATGKLPSGLDLGAHEVRAVYSGSARVAGSESSTTLTVEPRLASSMWASATQVAYGKAGTVTVRVRAATTPTGTVTLTFGGRTSSAALHGGKATFTLPSTWAPGTRFLTARYLGSTSLAPARTTVQATVTRAMPKVTASATTAVKRGRKATFTIKVRSAVAPETGTVRVYAGGKAVSKAVTLVRSGDVYQAKVTTGRLPKGEITVRYSGNRYLQRVTAATGDTVR
ncbi:Ig-like domain repeat protein [Demequina maris]|uniref:Ig-like domain repeat protein n=1 Tax=Demequina maris TaxID=1638982 RepID=UPI0007853688|nr:Ig-like domain repeat protein [Demequina maris]